MGNRFHAHVKRICIETMRQRVLHFRFKAAELNMTAQISESLTYQGKDYSLCAEPLSPRLVRRRNKHIRFQRRNTACSRGYVGSWEIVEDHLYLVRISANFPDGRAVTIGDLFPDSPDRVFAGWVTGELRCPSGRLLGYVHSGYSSVFERDLLLRFQDGVLVDQRTVVNEPPEPNEFDLLFDDLPGD